MDAITTVEPISTTRVSGYVVVSAWQNDGGRPDLIEYERCEHLNDAADLYTEYDRGEYRRARPVGIFPCDVRGMPIDKPLDPTTLTKMVRETRAA